MIALLLLTLLLPPLVASFDPGISNGTCYYGPNNQAANNFIPCGNAAGGVQSCCQARDICLSSNACFNGQFYVTYLAGCTDENYNDPKCPNKGEFSSQQWVGLVRCHVSDGASEEWGPCKESTDPKVGKDDGKCSCNPASSTAVFTDAAVLTNIASLPVSIGDAIFFSSGFEPSTTISGSTATGASSTRTPASVTASNTATPGSSVSSLASSAPTAPADNSSSSLSTGAKAGIGVSTTVGVCAIGALILWFGWLRRRRSRAFPPIENQIRPSSTGRWGTNNADLTDKPESDTSYHKSWGGKSELPTEANEVTTTKTSLGENTMRTSFNTPVTTYTPYHHSPTRAASEVDASPAGSTSRLAPGNSAYEKPTYGGPIYEMPA